MAFTTITKSSLYQNQILYTGDTSSSRSITGVGFQPDLVWVKTRNAANPHLLSDAVRGTNNNLASDSNAAAAVSYSQGWVSAFGADGYTAQAGSGGDNDINGNTNTYVAWNWKANGAGSSNEDGATSSTVSVDSTSKFSIVQFTGTGSTTTVGHGLGVTPEMIIFKNTSSAVDWRVYHKALGNTHRLCLNDNSASSDDDSAFNDTSPTSTIFTVGGSTSTNAGTMIAYCFASVLGFSKFGSYNANNNANGNFLYTGFKPTFTIFKKTNGTGSWWMHDSKTSPFNLATNTITANGTGAETTGVGVQDLVSNGIKLRGTTDATNGSGGEYIYAAFGQTMVGTNDIPATARQDMFGITAFCEAPFASQDIGIRIVEVTGVQVNTALGSSTITGNATVTLTGNALSVLTGTATVSIGEIHAVTGVQVEVALGTQTIAGGADVSVTGNVLSLDLGTVTVEVTTNVPVTGVQLQAQTGSVTIQGNATITVTGNALSVATGEAVAQPWTQVDDTNANTWTRVDQEINYGVNIQYNAWYRKNGSW